MMHKLINKFKPEVLTPILVHLSKKGLTIRLSNRFILFDFLQKVSNKIDEEPHLNFLSILKFHKILGQTLYGSVRELYRDRNKMFFKHFFSDVSIYERVKSDLEEVFVLNKDVRLTIFKKGLLIYDNYNTGLFNVLLLTVHAGQFIPPGIEKKLFLTSDERTSEEDILSDKLYRNIVLEKGGIWVDNKISRFYCDLNRSRERCIYDSKNENNHWRSLLTKKQEKNVLSFYDEAYFIFAQLINTYKFNMVFDGHTMRDDKSRPNISFGTHYIPKFYLPIVSSLKRKVRALGYSDVGINQPYEGGHILAWMAQQFPSIFIFSMEINKKLYLYGDRLRPKWKNIDSLALNLVKIFDIDEEQGYRLSKTSSK